MEDKGMTRGQKEGIKRKTKGEKKEGHYKKNPSRRDKGSF